MFTFREREAIPDHGGAFVFLVIVDGVPGSENGSADFPGIRPFVLSEKNR